MKRLGVVGVLMPSTYLIRYFSGQESQVLSLDGEM
jgi:hypothetical protein